MSGMVRKVGEVRDTPTDWGLSEPHLNWTMTEDGSNDSLERVSEAGSKLLQLLMICASIHPMGWCGDHRRSCRAAARTLLHSD